MSQIVFKLNQKPSYSERMTDARAELRRLIKEQLSTITGDPNATMNWSRKSYLKNVVQRYLVRIEGWPLNEVPFRNLSDVSNLPKLELLLRGWHGGSIAFCRISEAECDRMLRDPTPWLGPEPPSGEQQDDAAEQS